MSIIKVIYPVHDFYTTEVRCQCHRCPKVVRYNLNIKMHPHTKCEIVTSNDAWVMLGIRFSSIEEARCEGHSDLEQYVILQYPNMYP